MGLHLGAGETYSRNCYACEAKVVISRAEGNDHVNFCPYCGAGLGNHEPSAMSVNQSLDSVIEAIGEYRSTPDDKKQEIAWRLSGRLLSLHDEVVFFGKDLRRWHTLICLHCCWSGFGAGSVLEGESRGKSVCPACGSVGTVKELRA